MKTLYRRPVMLMALLFAFLLSMTLTAYAQGGPRVNQGTAFLEANRIPPEAFRELSANAADPNLLAQTLIKYGYTPEQAQTFMTPQNVMALRGVLNPSPANDLIARALETLAPYNLGIADLSALFPNLNNPQAMVAALMQKGLTQEQATQALQSAGPIIQEAQTSGMLQYAMINEQVGAILGAAGFNAHDLYSAANYLNDPEALAAYMQERGYTAAQIESFQGIASTLAAQGITGDLLNEYSAKQMIYRLEGLGLPAGSINDILALGDQDAIREYLADLGLDGSALELAMVNIVGIVGEDGQDFTAETLAQVQANEAAKLLEGAGIDPSDLGELLALRGDPDALSDYLAENYGLSAEQIAAFANGLENSTFAKTVDPEDVDDFIANLDAALEDEGGDDAAGDDSGEDVSDDSGSDDSADDSGADDSGGEGADDGGSDDSGGGEDSGGESGEG
jgi:hypothetical protein